jgi:sigma-B regulation protein RsbU (phosphoserine phosphatase)
MNFEFRSISSMMLTFFAGVLDLKSSSFHYANAGHNHPFILRSGKSIELPVSGPAIGFTNSITYTEQPMEVIPGDVIALFTDGLVETAYTEDKALVRFGSILERIEYGDEYHRRLIKAALAETGSKDFTDDVTIVTAKVL